MASIRKEYFTPPESVDLPHDVHGVAVVVREVVWLGGGCFGFGFGLFCGANGFSVRSGKMGGCGYGHVVKVGAFEVHCVWGGA